MVGKGEESKVGAATSDGELLGVKIVEPPAEAPVLKYPSPSFFISSMSTFTSFPLASTSLLLFLLSIGEADSSCILLCSFLSEYLVSDSLRMSRRDKGNPLF